MTADKNSITNEWAYLTKCIFEGKTRDEIAQLLHCSRSSVSYKMSKLYENYGVECRLDFILKIFSDILLKNRETIARQRVLIEKLKAKASGCDKVNKNQ